MESLVSRLFSLIFFAILIVGAVVVVAFLKTEMTASRQIDVNSSDLQIEATPEVLARGQKIFATRGCTDCHGENLGGKIFIDDPLIGRFAGANLTAGSGGRAGAYRGTGDWARAIRFGVAPSGRPLIFMPSNEYNSLTGRDLRAVIAYIKSAAPVSHESSLRVGPLARVLYMFGKFPMMFPYDLIPKNPPQPPEDIAIEDSVEYGAYVARSCVGCHGESLRGGPIPGAPPAWPPASDISSSGRIAQWTVTQFKTTLRSGQTPEGKVLNPAFMPWPTFAKLEDVELEALYRFLHH